MPHAGLQSAFDALFPKGQQWYWRADFVDTIPDAAVDVHPTVRVGSADLAVDHAPLPDQRGGPHVGPGDTAWAYRDATWGSVIAGIDPDPRT